ncbi:hypothetical protein ACFL1X_03045 [Candidatus Hydrogenedentota bacterium]
MKYVKTLTKTTAKSRVDGPVCAAATKWAGMTAIGDFMGPAGDLIALADEATGGIVSAAGAFVSAAYQFKVDLLSV